MALRSYEFKLEHLLRDITGLSLYACSLQVIMSSKVGGPYGSPVDFNLNFLWLKGTVLCKLSLKSTGVGGGASIIEFCCKAVRLLSVIS